MLVTFYKGFNKRINSTKQPTGGTDIEVYLKEGTSIESPTFMIDGIDLEYNYCKFNNHYYYINDITLGNRNIYEIHCMQDVLASHKSEIGSTSAYVEYSASDNNKWIPDTRLSMSNETQVSITSQSLFTTQSGSYIIAVAGTDTVEKAQVGLVNYYAINSANLKVLSDKLYSDDLIDELKKFFSDPFGALISAHWVPFDVATGTDMIYLGNSSSGAQGNGLKDYVNTSDHIVTYDLEVPWINNDWRDFSPYTKMGIWLPFYGMVELDASQLINGDAQIQTISIKVSFDAISGEVVYGINTGQTYVTYKVDTSVPLEVGQTTGKKSTAVAEMFGGASAVATGIGTLVAGKEGALLKGGLAIAGGIGGIGAGVLTMFSQDNSAKGGTGAFASANLSLKSYYGDILLYAITHKFGVDDPENIEAVQGCPLFAVRTISALSGYIKCAGASVNMSGLGDDKERVNQFLNSGFYYE